MSLRSTLWLSGLLLTLAACGGADSPTSRGEAGDVPTPQAPETTKIEVDGAAMLELVAGRVTTLRVRHVDYSGQPVFEQKLQFGLVGSAEGASLEQAEVRTDLDGYAMTTLKVGGTLSAFQVRASAAGATPAFFSVQVVEPRRPSLSLGVSYSGKRALESGRISVIDNMSCVQLQPKSSELGKASYVLSDLQQRVDYSETLGAGRTYAVVAWGSDDTNSTLATGCSDLIVPQTDQPALAKLDITVPLSDLPLSLVEEYDVMLDLDLSAPLAGLATRARTLVQAALPTGATPQASYLLDQLALRTKVDFSAARAELMLDARLEQRLAASKSGALRWFESLTSSVSEWGMVCSVEAQLTPALGGKPGQFAVSSIVSIRGGKSAREVDALAVPVGAAALDASYDDARAVLDIKSLRVPIGFGSYAVDVLEAVRASAVETAPLSPLDGCSELDALVNEVPAAFPGLSSLQLREACTGANQKLLDQVKADWRGLDAARPAVQLQGPVFAHDRDGNGRVDDLGPSPLSGDWANSAGASETKLIGTLRVTPKSALTI